MVYLLDYVYTFKSTSAFTLNSNKIKTDFIEEINFLNIINIYSISYENQIVFMIQKIAFPMFIISLDNANYLKISKVNYKDNSQSA